MHTYHRPAFHIIKQHVEEPRRFIQILAGPRQTGKTTLARQLLASHALRAHYASADEPGLKGSVWIDQQWEIARLLAPNAQALLILDEIHKIPDWPETVKKLWDADTLRQIRLQVLLLGSAPLLMQKGLSESLAGRFELIPIPHWSFAEMQAAFAWDLDHYTYYGGYPGAAELISDHERWSSYILNSLIETTLARDILMMTRVDKPALLKRLFELGCSYSGQVLSYQKMVGQLQDAGNTTTLAHYLQLLESAGLLAGLSKYSGQQVRQRSSSPKLQVLNTALMSVQYHLTFEEARKDAAFWGRLTESVIGAHLANAIRGKGIGLYYWNEGHHEVDFVLTRGRTIAAIEVKSGRLRDGLPGMARFSKQFKVGKMWLAGKEGIPIEDFLNIAPEELLGAATPGANF